MNILRKLSPLFIIVFFIFSGLSASGVTKKDMDQARAIAAKAYLRYANDGSGYLDDINPKSLDELEKSLKPKEKENIKAFKAIAVPTNYSDWDKEQLVKYWAETAFQDKGLLEKGRGGRIRARSQINKMTLESPQTAAATPAATTAPTAANATTATSETPQELLNDEQQILAENQELEEPVTEDKAPNYTWVYIMVLAILVAIVVVLIVYAANVFKKNSSDNEEEGHPRSNSNHTDAELKEHYESVIADRDVEIARLSKRIGVLTQQNDELKATVESLTVQLAASNNVADSSLNIEEEIEEAKYEEPRQPEPQRPSLRSIFLGRANSKGIFIRADRTLNVGNSVFLLETGDGFSGTFRVADSQAAWSLALSNPKEYLETACTGHDLNDTAGASKIVTEAAGTAVFEGGCWRVIRKARIKYE